MIAHKKLPEIPLEEFEFYTQKHIGKKMVIKVSGGEFEKEEFQFLLNTIHLLLENDITIFFVFGGGVQIDDFYKQYSKTPRKKIEGVGITTPEVMENGVIPAYNFLIEKLQKKFIDISFDINILSPQDIQVEKCSDCEKFGLVANPQHINIDESKALHIIGFVGEDMSKQKYNINADEIALSIVKTQEIDEVIFITGTGGLLNNSGEIISKVFERDLQEMIEGTFPAVHVSGGMKKKCEEILELLKRVKKVAMAKSETLQQELFTHNGAGTLCVR
jgi:acetylglutamate kinase